MSESSSLLEDSLFYTASRKGLMWENGSGPERCANTSNPGLDQHHLSERKC